ncbi:helix-turn-helix transcriptional regulator [Jiella sp. MQZ13P-4]|uniref:Helix-turn-helix transcriptional regulator n=1 Tax=Jiella sonneratiae TaxID=2816856 RepID=A0ABS3J2B3_9HYPH|nr:helix-turn-helix transcriptional regulator [Jiella sonneratiae]
MRELTPSELGRMIGVSGLHILQFENGTRRLRSSDSQALAGVLNAKWLIVEEPAISVPKSDQLAVVRRRILRLVQSRAAVGRPSSVEMIDGEV